MNTNEWAKKLTNLLLSAKLQETSLFTTRQSWTEKTCDSIHVYRPIYLKFDGDQARIRSVHNTAEYLIQKIPMYVEFVEFAGPSKWDTQYHLSQLHSSDGTPPASLLAPPFTSLLSNWISQISRYPLPLLHLMLLTPMIIYSLHFRNESASYISWSCHSHSSIPLSENLPDSFHLSGNPLYMSL